MRMNRLGGAFVATGLAAPAVWLLASSALGATRDQQAAEGFEWFWAINGPVAADGGGDLSVDDEGNVFLAGSHAGLDMDRDGEVDFESGASAYVGAHNALFMKLSRGPSDDRLRLRWMRSPRTPADRSATKIAADGRGGAFVIGAFMESIAFEDGPTLPGGDLYVARWRSATAGPTSTGTAGRTSSSRGTAPRAPG
jgi:hypothetical protein